MTLASLKDVLEPAQKQGYGIAGLVVLGWEDACAFVEVADNLGVPVILQAGPGCRAHIPVSVLGPMFRHLAEQARVPVVCHIDHATSLAECQAGIDYGFTSVMIDGSRLSLADNITLTSAVTAMARPYGVSVEAEIGFVGYNNGAVSHPTQPDEAAELVRVARPDALAVSVGNVHLQTSADTVIDRPALAAIEAVVDCPLVLHGSSGILPAERHWLAANSSVCKFNFGTEIRQIFGEALRDILAENPNIFDRNEILVGVKERIALKARELFSQLS